MVLDRIGAHGGACGRVWAGGGRAAEEDEG